MGETRRSPACKTDGAPTRASALDQLQLLVLPARHGDRAAAHGDVVVAGLGPHERRDQLASLAGYTPYWALYASTATSRVLPVGVAGALLATIGDATHSEDHNGGQNAEDDDHDQEFDEGEALVIPSS